MSTKLRFIQLGDERGDCTASYVVEIRTKDMTVKEFIDIILKDMNSDWGEIKFYLSHLLRYYDVTLRYQHGEILTAPALYEQTIKDIEEKKVIGITADGGWTRMDYVVTIE